jgi:L-ascorbate metabolism protein UlaG (beta-lactamase superfamily)
MEIHYYGANCIRLNNKKASIVIDDNLVELGLKSVIKPEDVTLYTFNKKSDSRGRFLINGPGEYEISEVSIIGIPVKAHIDESGAQATIYSLQTNGLKVAMLGHIYPELSDEQLETLGIVDVLIIPVGGNGYTLDAADAARLIKKIEPKIVIPTHYADNSIKYEVPQAELQVFLSEMGISDPELIDSLKLKEAELGDKTQVVVLKRSGAK